MPSNPFGGSESSAEARALASLEAARRRISSSIKDQTVHVRGLAAAQRQAASSAAQARRLEAEGSNKTIAQLRAQGIELDNLDSIREDIHQKEMKRSKSLLESYESIKQSLEELGKEADDTNTVLGSMLEGVNRGTESFQRFGDVSSQNVIQLNSLHANYSSLTNVILGVSSSMREGYDAANGYVTAAYSLRDGLKGVGAELGLAEKEADKTAYAFMQMANIDLNSAGQVESVLKITKSLSYLKLQGVDTAMAMKTLVNESKRTGKSFEQSAHELDVLAVQSHMLEEQLSGTKNVLQGFGGVIRNDFIRAVAEATRTIDSQVVSLQDVGAMYSIATERAAAYGLSTEHAAKVTAGLIRGVTKERKGPMGFLAGRRIRQKFNADLEEAAKAMGFDSYADITDEATRQKAQNTAFTAMGVAITPETRNQRENFMRIKDNNGMGNQDAYNLMAGTRGATTALITELRQKFGHLEETERYRLINQQLGTTDLSTNDQMDLARMVMEGSADSLATKLKEINDSGEDAEARDRDRRRQTLAAINHMRHPIDSIFALKEYLFAIMTNMDNLLSFARGVWSAVSSLPFFKALGIGDSVAADQANAARARNKMKIDNSDEVRNAAESEKKANDHLIEVVRQVSHVFTDANSSEGDKAKARKKIADAQKALVEAPAAMAAARQHAAKRMGLVPEAEMDQAVQAVGGNVPGGPKKKKKAPPAPSAGRIIATTVASPLLSNPRLFAQAVSPALTGMLHLAGSLFSSDDEEEGRSEGTARLAEQNAAASARASGGGAAASSSSSSSASTVSRPASPGLPSTVPGEGEAEGAGEASITMDESGQAMMNFSLKVNNMHDAISQITAASNAANRQNGTQG